MKYKRNVTDFNVYFGGIVAVNSNGDMRLSEFDRIREIIRGEIIWNK